MGIYFLLHFSGQKEWKDFFFPSYFLIANIVILKKKKNAKYNRIVAEETNSMQMVLITAQLKEHLI